MIFSEKLTFLMHVSGASSKGLAEFLHVDPSRISQMKTGRRGRPRDSESLRSMASFFARHCTSNSQRIALSEGIGHTAFSNKLTTEELSEAIFCWLMDTPIPAPNPNRNLFLEGDPKASTKEPSSSKDVLSSKEQEQFVFYGNEGKRNAIRLMYQQALELNEPQTIYVCNEENPTWYYEDSAFLAELEEKRILLAKKGMRIIHILDLNTSLSVAYENLLHWIPSYITGNVEPYYYPRIRDGVFNHTFIIIPGKICLFSASIANNPNSRSTLVSTNSFAIEETTAFFLDYLNICIPAMKIYRTHEEAHRCIAHLSTIPSDRLQKRTSLPPSTLPMSILKDYAQRPNDSYRSDFARFYIDHKERIESDLLLFEDIEICPIATAEEVRSGKVRIEVPSIIKDEKEFYTPQTYALHLQNILRTMETYEKFHLIPIPYDENDYIAILIKHSKKAVLTNCKDGLITLDTEHSDMVKVFQEFLLRYVHSTNFRNPRVRQQIMNQLQSLIAELTN